jgi:hypothetical protein
MKEKTQEKRMPKLWEALFTLAFLAITLAVGIAGWEL